MPETPLTREQIIGMLSALDHEIPKLKRDYPGEDFWPPSRARLR